MRIEFVKMNGAGNDFVMVDNRAGNVRLDAATIARLCDRRRGIGADGLILIDAVAGHDFFMNYHNADGLPERMCGNGARCSAWFAADLGVGTRADGRVTVRFLTGSGPIAARIVGESVRMEMMDAAAMRRNVRVSVAHPGSAVHFMTVGTRHAVVEVEDAGALTADDVFGLGRALRHDAAFAPEGANINFASVDRDGRVILRTYEKGVEAETFACGTGSVAAAVAFAHQGRTRSPVRILQRSGDEIVATFETTPTGATRVTMEGPVAVNFRGRADV